MDFGFTEEQQKSRDKYFSACKELSKKRPAGCTGLHTPVINDEGWAYHRYCMKEFAKRGWLTLAWPANYGGHGTIMDRVFLAEARAYYGVPGIDSFAIGMLAPTLFAKANEDIKTRFLPGIATGETMWCELWSEPNAGSDLASLTTTAIRKGNEYIINGQKTWNSFANHADWGFGLFKSDPNGRKHHNLTFLLLNMKTPGITVRPLGYMHGEYFYNEVFFDDVHVPANNIVGEENEGWGVTQILAGFERSHIDLVACLQHSLNELIEYCNTTTRNGHLISRDPLVRNRVAELACEIEAIRMTCYKVIDMQSRNEMANMDAAVVKITSSELTERMAKLGTDIMGPYGQVKFSRWAINEGAWPREYQECFCDIIAMGSNEIQRNIIAWSGLGLPRMK